MGCLQFLMWHENSKQLSGLLNIPSKTWERVLNWVFQGSAHAAKSELCLCKGQSGCLSWASATMQPVDKIILWGLGIKLEASTFELRLKKASRVFPLSLLKRIFRSWLAYTNKRWLMRIFILCCLFRLVSTWESEKKCKPKPIPNISCVRGKSFCKILW